MCLILFSYNHHPDYRLILAANRDEFYDRATAPLAFWADAPGILAGRDRKENGTWMGIDRFGRFAALTNFRDPASLRPDAPSRGALVSDFLRGPVPPRPYLEALQPMADRHNGFNLLVGDGDCLYYFSNRTGEIRKLDPGIYGLSNRFLDTPWPKVESGKQEFERMLSQDRIETESLFRLLADRTRPPDDKLPNTGVGVELERMLSSRFITGEYYGTRSSSVLLMGRDHRVRFSERTFVQKSGRILPEKTRSVTFLSASP
ncbi:MAG: NRDE family protein [Thermodesulfobacteriota bacterium]